MPSTKQVPVRRPEHREAPEAEAMPTSAPGGEELIDAIDDLLDEIDTILEDQEVLMNFRQRSGQ